MIDRYEVVRDDGGGYYVIDLYVPACERGSRSLPTKIVARFYGYDDFKNAKAFCFMKNMWGDK